MAGEKALDFWNVLQWLNTYLNFNLSLIFRMWKIEKNNDKWNGSNDDDSLELVNEVGKLKVSYVVVIIWTIPNWNLFSPFPNKEALKDLSSNLCSFKFFAFQCHIHEYNFNAFSSNLHSISLLLLNLNSNES